MRITVITACFNVEKVIRTAIESVLRQSWTDLEYWVIDGASTDGTVGIIKEYAALNPRKIKWLSEPSASVYEAMNKGIRMATGEVIGILNADDVLSADDVIEKVAIAFGWEGTLTEAQRAQRRVGSSKVLKCESSKVEGGEAIGNRQSAIGRGEASSIPSFPHSGIPKLPTNELTNSRTNELLPDAIYGDIRFVANRAGVRLDELRAEETVRYYSSRHWRPWMLQWGFMPPHPSVYVRRACFERLGDYALDYRIAADYALLIRFLRRAGLRARYVPMCFVDMRVGGMSTKNWRSNLLLNREIVRGNREAGYPCCLPMLVPKYAFKIFEFVGPKIRRWAISKKQ